MARRTVRVRGIDPRLLLASQDHQDDLVRELQLASIGTAQGARHGVPGGLGVLLGDLLARYADVRSAARAQAVEAARRGQETVDLELPVLPGMADALLVWLDVLTEADERADEGELLTIPTTPAIRALRRDYVRQIVDQLRG